LTTVLNAHEIAARLAEKLPGGDICDENGAVVVENGILFNTAELLKNDPEFDFNYLANLTSVDYMDFFEVVYNLVSLNKNHSLVLKTRCYDRNNPTVSSVYELWQTADYQEREVFDLMGIVFEGHPNLKRLFLWEGFPGHPLRRDYL